MRFGGFEATIDAYRINIRDRIVLSENLNTPQVAALLVPFDVTVARFFINGVETRTQGIDLVARYGINTENAGKFDLTAAGNWNDTDVEKVPSTNVIDNICNGQPQPCTPPVLFARVNTLSFEEGTPASKITLAADWSIPLGGARWGANLRGTRYGEVVEPGVPTTAEINAGAADVRDLHIPADWVVDLALNAKFLEEKLAVTLGADNLLDQYPSKVPHAVPEPASIGGIIDLNATGALGFSRFSPYGFNGRFVYARMSYHW
jgi:iron complex outermembrane receptor protein